MRASIASRAAAVMSLAIVCIAASTHAGNRLQVVQRTAACNFQGGGEAIAVSPDGAHVYEFLSYTVLVSSRDALTGHLTRVQTTFMSRSGYEARFSPDGEFLYVVGYAGVTVFDRDTVTGMLTLVETDAVPGTAPAIELDVSPDGKHVYVRTGRRTDSYGEGLLVFARNPTTGTLSVAYEYTMASASDIAVSPDGAQVYVSEDTGPSSVVRTYARDSSTGLLTALGTTAIAGEGIRIVVSADGANVYVVAEDFSAYPSVGNVVTLARDAGTGLLTQIGQVAHPLLATAQARDVALAPGDEQLYVAVETGLVAFDRSPVDGSLTLKEQYLDDANGIDGLWPTYDVAVTPDGAHVYTIGEGTVTFARDVITGTLTFIDDREEGAGAAAGLLVSPDGKHVYRSCGDAVTTMSRAPLTGMLTESSSIDAPGSSDMYMAPDGRHVLRQTLGLVVLERDDVTGALAYVTQYAPEDWGWLNTSLIRPVAFSPDGKNVYIVGDASVLALTRDPATGLLTPLAAYAGGVGGVPASFNITDVTVSPDGRYVYLASWDFWDSRVDGIAVFARDSMTGALTFASRTVDGGGPFKGIAGLAASANGMVLYASGIFPSGVSAFARNAMTGALKPRYTIGTPEASPGYGRQVTVNPAGTFLYTVVDSTAFFPRGRELYVLRTDPMTGALGPVETVPGLGNISGQAVSPDGAQLYALQTSGDVSVLVSRPVCSAAPVSTCVGATASTLKITSKSGTSGRLTWKWKASGGVTTGDPLTTTEYALCVYDGSAATQPVFSSAVPPGRTCGNKPCWAATATGYKYTDRVGTPDGVTAMRMTNGLSTTASIVLEAKGASLPPLGLPYTAPLTVQMQASTGDCWQAAYTTAAVDDASRLVAKQ